MATNRTIAGSGIRELSQKRILVTGATGFIGRKICEALAEKNSVTGLCFPEKSKAPEGVVLEKADLLDRGALDAVLLKHSPDIVIHCAGIAHQKMGRVRSEQYMAANCLATDYLARRAIEACPEVHFVFLSSISVYGEGHAQGPVHEEGACHPSSDYASSKFAAENCLKALHGSGKLKKLDILRLAPVYDSHWSLNLDKRVFAPGKWFYIQFGSGRQEMSLLSRQNLVGFVVHRLTQADAGGLGGSFSATFNVCDRTPSNFAEIIRVFKKSQLHPDRYVLKVPLGLVWVLTRLAGMVAKDKRAWLHSCYDKLACSLVFDNQRMLETGYVPGHALESVFL